MMCIVSRITKIFCSSLFLLMLNACTPLTNNVIQATESLEISTPVLLETVPEFHPLADYEYQAYTFRSPFVSPNKTLKHAADLQDDNCSVPDISRKISPLEAYEMEAILMSGVIRVNKVSIVLLKTTDGKLHHARIGDFLGLFHGQITHIHPDHTIISELIPSVAGCYRRQETRLSINMNSKEAPHA
jgi:type IV pilus assembly protein PilP